MYSPHIKLLRIRAKFNISIFLQGKQSCGDPFHIGSFSYLYFEHFVNLWLYIFSYAWPCSKRSTWYWFFIVLEIILTDACGYKLVPSSHGAWFPIFHYFQKCIAVSIEFFMNIYFLSPFRRGFALIFPGHLLMSLSLRPSIFLFFAFKLISFVFAEGPVGQVQLSFLVTRCQRHSTCA